MDLTWLLDRLGGTATVSLAGLLLGLLFGAAAQQSRFCLRAAAVEFARGTWGKRLSGWLLAFSSAVLATQALIQVDLLDLGEARQLGAVTSLSGAVIGGLMFGCGMVMAHGCASRLLVLSATGNLRALLSGLVFAVTAQASLRGILAPARDALAGLWVVDGRWLLALMPDPGGGLLPGFLLGLAFLLGAVVFAVRSRLGLGTWIAAMAAGGAVALGWLLTYSLSTQAFDTVPVESITFTGPSADALMIFLSPLASQLDFDVGLVPGVFLGSFLAAWLAGELELVGFQGAPAIRRYLSGAVLMGFGGMLAGGCAVGNGMAGSSVFAVTAWVALGAMWLGAGLTDLVLDRRSATVDPASPAARTAG